MERVPRWVGPALGAMLILSGAAGLAYQVLWVRQLVFVLGGSSIAISTILAIFFAGLGLGSFFGGKIADRASRPLRYYALAEVLIGLTALATPYLLSASGSVYLGLYELFAGSPGGVLFSRSLATALILIVPTTLMGATLPLVSRFYIRSVDRVGRGLGLLYGLNTLGAVLGAGIVGYYTILTVGVQSSFFLAVAANLIAGLGALVLDSAAGRSFGTGADSAAIGSGSDSEPELGVGTESEAMPATGPSTAQRRVIQVAFLGFALSGLTSIAYEVLWTRALNFAIGNSVYAYTTILVVFLAGLVPGALLAGWMADRTRTPMRILGWIQVLTAVSVLGLYTQAERLPHLTNSLVARFGAGELFADILTKVVPAAVALFIPAVIIGLTFPLVLRVVSQQLPQLGRKIGQCYAVNTVGGIVGSTLAGFVLLPTIGMTRGMIVIALLNLLLAAAFFAVSERPRDRKLGGIGSALAAALAFVAIFVVEPAAFVQYTSIGKQENRQLVSNEEGHTATVAVTDVFDEHGERESRDLHINLLGASVVDRDFYHQQYYAMVSLLPAALHLDPKSVFVAGLASGVTAGAAGLDQRTENVVCVEISPEVIHAAAEHFNELNYGASTNPKIRILADDARAYMFTTDERFDIIVTDVFLSALTGTSALYSLDYFNLCRDRLAPGGVMSVGVGSLKGTDRVVARTFLESFPYVAVFTSPLRRSYNMVFLLGSNEPFTGTQASVRSALAQARLGEELSRFGVESPEVLIDDMYLTDHASLLNSLQTAEICTDDRPIIDFHTVAWAEGFVAQTNKNTPGAGIMVLKRRLGGTRPIPWLDK